MWLGNKFAAIVCGVCGLIFLMAMNVMGQEVSKSDTADIKSSDERSYLLASIKYTSDVVYMGRKDSVKAPYVTPALGYYHKSGLFIDASLSYLVAAYANRIDLSTVSTGYYFDIKKLSGGIAVSLYFYNDESYAVKSPITEYITLDIGYEFNLVNFYLFGSIGFSEETDVFLSGELDHTFYALNDHLKIIPAFSINFGTQNYYDEYYQNRGAGKKKGQGSGRPSPQSSISITSESTKFQVLNYELSMQFSYTVSRFRIFFIPTIAFPQNPAKVTSNQVTVTEDLQNTFFWSLGLSYKLSK